MDVPRRSSQKSSIAREGVLLAGYLISAALFASCGAKSSGPSKEELAVEIEAEIAALNSCQVVEDCESVSYPACRTQYIHRDADRTQLDELLADYFAGEDQSCAAICECALLRCLEGRCDLSSHDCSPSTEGISTCF